MHSARSTMIPEGSNQARRAAGLSPRGAGLARVLLVLLCIAAVAPLHAQTPPDAVIELWEQHWTLNADGSTVYHSKQHVRLNSDRAYREFVDPRITYNVDTDQLEIINARVKRADGTYRELPDYSHVAASPDSSAGWPAFASIRQHLIVMSGIEPGCVVELEYKITSEPGAKPYLAADVRLDHRYPVRKHTIGIDTPANVRVRGSIVPATSEMPASLKSFSLENHPGVPDEPQSPPSWPGYRQRLAFSSAPSADAWLRRTVDHIDAAADEPALTAELATEWTKDCLQPAEKLRAIQKKLAASFNFVEFNPAWRPAKLRPASETLRSNHGMPEEAAAVFLSLARAAGVPVRLGILTDDDVWTDSAPQRAVVAAYVLLLDSGTAPEIWDAHRGRIMRDSRWAGHTLLAIREGKLQRTPLPAWTDADESRCTVNGNVIISEDGTFSGKLSLLTTGLFVLPESLRSSSDQKSRVSALVRRVLPDAKVESLTVTTLGAGEFAVEAKIKSSKALKKLSGSHRLTLAQDGPFRANVSMPLSHGQRRNPVRLAGAFDEQIELTIAWPEGWTVEAQPMTLKAAGGEWGEVRQEVTAEENRLTLTRHVRVTQRELSAKSFLELRGPLNELRADAARNLLLKP